MRDVRQLKLRARRRARSGGAIIFIVAMTLVVLGSMGVYALRAASTEVRTSGYARQNTQTHYLSEYGVLAGAHEVHGAKAALFLQMMNDPVTRDTACPSLATVPATAPDSARACRRVSSTELGATWTALDGTQRTPLRTWGDGTTEPVTPGSLGRAHRTGEFVIELTEPSGGISPPGYDQRLGLCFVQFTMTVTGMTFPDQGGISDLAKFGGAGVESARARITGGPVRCPQ